MNSCQDGAVNSKLEVFWTKSEEKVAERSSLCGIWGRGGGDRTKFPGRPHPQPLLKGHFWAVTLGTTPPCRVSFKDSGWTKGDHLPTGIQVTAAGRGLPSGNQPEDSDGLQSGQNHQNPTQQNWLASQKSFQVGMKLPFDSYRDKTCCHLIVKEQRNALGPTLLGSRAAAGSAKPSSEGTPALTTPAHPSLASIVPGPDASSYFVWFCFISYVTVSLRPIKWSKVLQMTSSLAIKPAQLKWPWQPVEVGILFLFYR